MNKNLHQRKGFTIIEVVLVLAIAALIILMVFIAWPALQRTQRDQARKNDVALIGSVIGTFKSNNKGKLPDICQLNDLVATQGTSIYGAVECKTGSSAPAGTDVVSVRVASGGTASSGLDKIEYSPSARCQDNKAVSGGSARQAVLLYSVESNGTVTPQCQDF